MDLFETVIIAIVEGLTEFLPVSSTGHMIIAQSLLGVESTPFVKAFTVIIQFGAILSVICLYWKRFFYPNAGREGKSYWRAMFDFYARLVVGVVPAAVLGFAFNDEIEANLGNVQLVAWMLIIGGIFMLFCDRIFNRGRRKHTPYVQARLRDRPHPVHLDDTGRVALNGYHRRRNEPAAHPQGRSRVLVLPCRAHNVRRHMP